MHETGLLLTVTIGLTVALVFGILTQRAGLSPIVGYLLAGVAVGPHTPGFVADAAMASQLAEIGVILLMFGVGLHFHLDDLLAVKGVAVPGAIVQSAIATALGAWVAHRFGWTLGAGLILGVGISVASTVVLMRVLMDHRRLDSPEGHVAVGWLVVEDLFTVLVLVLLPAVAQASRPDGGGALSIAWAVISALLKVALFGWIMLRVGTTAIPWLLRMVARARSNELATLTVLVLALAIAFAAAALFGVSMALGAFMAGMVVGRSPVAHQAAANALPLRDAFAVLFFVSVGMLFDPRFLLAQPGLVLATLAIILVGKPLVAFAVVTVLGYSVRTALTAAVGLAQIGEFSFILADVAHRLELIPSAGHNVLVAGAMISISLNPLLFGTVGRIEDALRARRWLWWVLNRRTEARGAALNRAAQAHARSPGAESHAVVVGHGPVGQTVARILRDFGFQPTIVEMNVDTVSELAAGGRRAIYGDASQPHILEAAGIASARYLVVTLPDLASRLPVIIAARQLNADLKIFVRAHYLGERSLLEEVGATSVCYEEAEAAVALAAGLLQDVGADAPRIAEEAKKIREEFALRPASPAPEVEPTLPNPSPTSPGS